MTDAGMEVAAEAGSSVMIDPVTGGIVDQQQIAEQLLEKAKAEGVFLVGPGGLLGELT